MLNEEAKLSPKVFKDDILPSQILQGKTWEGEQKPTRAGYGSPFQFFILCGGTYTF